MTNWPLLHTLYDKLSLQNTKFYSVRNTTVNLAFIILLIKKIHQGTKNEGKRKELIMHQEKQILNMLERLPNVKIYSFVYLKGRTYK